jgi:hypothetical protein
VKPRRPFQQRPGSRWHVRAAERFLRDAEQLDDPVADLELDGKRAPVLIRQYLRLGGRSLAVNVDPAFGYALDALIVVNLREAPRAILNRYMGAAAAEAFLRGPGSSHRMPATTAAAESSQTR